MSEHCTEIWRDIPSYEGFYQASNLGRIKSLSRIVRMKDGPNGTFQNRVYRVGEKIVHGSLAGCYYVVVLSKEGKEKTLLVHRLILEAFMGLCPDGMECRHLDGNPRNNQLSNLRWGTRTENALDRIRHGTAKGQAPGEGHSLVKLTEIQVREIRLRTSQGERPCYLGREFHVSERTIRDIRDRRSWRHI